MGSAYPKNFRINMLSDEDYKKDKEWDIFPLISRIDT